MKEEKNKKIVLNGIIAAVYLVLTIMVSPIAQGPIQLRVSESLNHIVVFNKKLMWGVFAGVFLYNLLFSMYGLLDVVFGSSQTLLALGLTAFLSKYIKDEKYLLFLNTIIFSASMFLVAWMLQITAGLPFWPTYGWTALSEFLTMAVSAPIMYMINKKFPFKQ